MLIALNVIIAPLVVYYAHRKFYKGIDFSYRISSISWFGLHFSVYFFSLALMFFCSILSNAIQNVGELNSLQRWGYIFIQQGGGVIFVMVLSSLLYRLLLYSEDLDYAMGYNVTMCKLFFSIVCISCVVLFLWMWEVQGENNDFEMSQLMMWAVVLVQIWIGFGTGCEGRTSSKSKKIEIWRDRKYYSCYFFSMIAPVVLLVLILLNNGEISEWMIKVEGIIFVQLFVLLASVIVFSVYSNPTNFGSYIRVYFLVKRLFKRTKVYRSHYRGLAYEVWIKNDLLHVRVWGRKVINISAGFTKDERQEIKKGIQENITSTDIGNIRGKKQGEIRKVLIDSLEKSYEKRRKLMRSTFDKARVYFEEAAKVAKK